MEVLSCYKSGVLNIALRGEMDECSASSTRLVCDKLIDDVPNASRIVFDLSNVAFMDSTGIGFLIGRYKKAMRLQIPVYIHNPNLAADKILNMSGVYALMPKTASK